MRMLHPCPQSIYTRVQTQSTPASRVNLHLRPQSIFARVDTQSTLASTVNLHACPKSIYTRVQSQSTPASAVNLRPCPQSIFALVQSQAAPVSIVQLCLCPWSIGRLFVPKPGIFPSFFGPKTGRISARLALVLPVNRPFSLVPRLCAGGCPLPDRDALPRLWREREGGIGSDHQSCMQEIIYQNLSNFFSSYCGENLERYIHFRCESA